MRLPRRNITVKRYKGERSLRRGLNSMSRRGWEVQTQSTRKMAWSPFTGLFTRRQIHTVTFVRAHDDA